MGFYRKVDTRMHGDLKYLALSGPHPNGRSLFEWLIHGPFSNSIGVYHAGEAAMAEALGWPVKGFRDALREVIGQGLADYCPEHRMLLLPNFLKYNLPVSINALKSALKVLDSLPQCHLKGQWIQRLQAISEAMPEGFRHGIRQAIAEPMKYGMAFPPTPTPTPTPEKRGGGPGEDARTGPSPPPTDDFAGWPPTWDPIKARIQTLPFLERYQAWLTDLGWWLTQDEKFAEVPATLDHLLCGAVAFITSTRYKPRTREGLLRKLHNCLEVEARKAEREAQAHQA